MGPPYNRCRRLSENQPDRAQNSFPIASAKFSHESSVRESRLGNNYPSLLMRGWLDSGQGQAEGDEFSDGSTTSECESGVDGHEESVANLCDEDEILEYLTKLANLPEIISPVPSTVKSPQEPQGHDLNEWKTPNAHNLTPSSSYDKDTIENLIPTITDHEVVQSLQLDAGKEPSQSGQSGNRTS
ncbi:hypothetical protein HOY80DRAFT_1109896 [Tuber brumale]|nr:hypothetical protein HOY80DRAFT_1109896 [Tuber brumale]